MIDYRIVRNKFREWLIIDSDVVGRENNLVEKVDFVFEGRTFTPTEDLYVEEIIRIDNDTLEAAFKSLTSVTISYNVKGLLSATANMQKEVEDLRLAICEVFDGMEPFVLSGLGINIMEVSRRPSTNKDGWRLAAVDVTVDCILRS